MGAELICAGRQTDGQTDRQTDRQIDGHDEAHKLLLATMQMCLKPGCRDTSSLWNFTVNCVMFPSQNDTALDRPVFGLMEM